jgi:hypothetical protein
MYTFIILVLVQLSRKNMIVCGLHENDKMSISIMIGCLLFKEIQI